MPPPPPPKRIKRPATILDEDVYTGALSHIIARDFFPGLLETQAQQEYLDAVEARDPQWIAEAGRKLNDVMAPGSERREVRGRRENSAVPLERRAGQTPRGWSGATPVADSTPLEALADKPEPPPVDLNMSLSAFTAKYTSEDNESFNTILDKQNLKKREKNAWVWHGNNIPSRRLIAHQERQLKLSAAGAADDGQPTENTQLVLHTSLADNRKAMPDTHRTTPRNNLMFVPDSVEDTHLTLTQAAENESKSGLKAVVHHNTRLPIQGPVDEPIPPSPSISAINAAISGNPRRTPTELNYQGNETPRVNGYAYVDEDPTPPELELPDTSTLLARLGSSSTGPSPFRMNEASKREELHHKLVERTAMKKRGVGRIEQLKDEPNLSSKTPTPKFASAPNNKAGNLTPAAQKLLERVGTPLRKGAFDEVDGSSSKKTDRSSIGTPVRIKRRI